MTKIIVSNTIKVYQPPTALLNWADKELVATNPEYIKKERMGRWTGSTPRELTFYNRTDEYLELPFGCFKAVYARYPRNCDYTHTFSNGTPVDYTLNIELRDYQREAVKAAVKARNGVIQAPCGSGKTITAMGIIAALKQRALWITHTKDLLKQSIDAARNALGLSGDEIGVISDGKYKIGSKVTFATVQTLKNFDFNEAHWNVVIVDEAHRAFMSGDSACMFADVINRINARYKIGLTATAARSDGLIKTMFFLLGDIFYDVPKAAIADKLMPVEVKFRKTRYSPSDYTYNSDDTPNYTRLIGEVVQDNPRNCLIVKDIEANVGKQILVLSDRLRHLQCLRDSLKGVKSALICGTSKTQERADAIQAMRERKIQILFATYNLAKEGLDIPCLERLFLTAPKKDFSVVTQCAGRIARKAEGKTDAVIYDYVDVNSGILENQYKKRLSTYRKNGYKTNLVI